MKCPVCKKNIPESSLKCPFCKSRTGLLCSKCNTVNPIGSINCKSCGSELLKICKHCNGVNFPDATKCRKCGLPFENSKQTQPQKEHQRSTLEYNPKYLTHKQAFDTLTDGILSNEKKIFSIAGSKGIGKTTLLKQAIKNLEKEHLQWCIGECSPITQLSPGGVIQDMLLNTFNLPNFCINNEEFQQNAMTFFENEFKFLKKNEISEFINFLYNYKEGNYEDIINNKRRTYEILLQIFGAFANTGRFVFVIDNFDFIDGFSVEFFTTLMHKTIVQKNLKFIALYNKPKPINSYFLIEELDIKAYVDINLAPMSSKELAQSIQMTSEAGTYITEREKEVILEKSCGNPAFVEQATSYCFDCQISDKAFLLTNNFENLILDRLETLKKINQEAHKLLCCAAILGNKLNLVLLKDIFGYKNQKFLDIMSYLVKSNFVRPYNQIYYEFNNLLLWETILKNITRDSSFADINVKIGKAISLYTLNTNATMAMIAHNLKENRMAFDIWTKTTRLASYIGDINLYVISQKQCLALLNEFNENETLNIRFNISERLGKLLTEYDPEEAMEYLPDAIANAKSNNNEAKEIELLSYLAQCCKKTGNYFGEVECADNVLKKLKPEQTLEIAMVKSTKLTSLLDIGNCGEVVNIIDNDIMPILNEYLSKPKSKMPIPIGLVYDTWVRTNLELANALSLQGNDRCFEILTKLFDIIEKHKIDDQLLICKAKLILAFANTMKGDFATSQELLEDIGRIYRKDIMDAETISRWNMVFIINKFLLKDYDDLREILFNAVTFANNIGDNYAKNILKVFLGKTFKDNKQAKHALEIYNEQVTYFAKEKMALGALLSWYFIAEATLITEGAKNAIDIATQALEIAQNPRINNSYFIVLLKILLAKANMEKSDFESAKINLETAMILAKKYNMNDLLAKIYYLWGKYNQELGSIQSTNQLELLKGAIKMYDKSINLIQKYTKNKYLFDKVNSRKTNLMKICEENGFKI